jgi:hypothetical protein
LSGRQAARLPPFFFARTRFPLPPATYLQTSFAQARVKYHVRVQIPAVMEQLTNDTKILVKKQGMYCPNAGRQSHGELSLIPIWP